MKKIQSFLLTVVLLFFVLIVNADTESELKQQLEDLQNQYDAALINKNSKPDFILEGDNIYGPFNTDGIQNIGIRLKNNSSVYSKELWFDLVEPTENTEPFLLQEGSELHKKLDEFYGGSSNVINFKFKLKQNVDPKNHKLILKIRYKNNFGISFEKELPIYIKVENNFVKPSLSIGDYDIDGGYVSSKNAKKLKIKVLNSSNIDIKSVTSTLVGMSADGIILFEDSDSKLIGDMNKGSDIYVYYNIKATEGAKGSQNMSLKLEYFDDQGNKYEKEWPIYLNTDTTGYLTKDLKVEFTKEMYKIKVDNDDSIQNTTKIGVNVTNTSNKDFKNIKLELSVDGGIKFITPYIKVFDIKANETKHFDYTLSANEQSSTGIASISARVSDLNSNNSEVLAISGINVEKNSDSKSKPKIIISEYSYGLDYVKAGDIFDVNIKFLNTSSVLGIKNVKVNYESEDGVFVPVNQTNSFFFPSISPSQTASKTITLKVKPDAKVKLHTITFKLEYEDSNGKSYDQKGNLFTSEEKITINVKQDVRLELGDPVLPDEIIKDENANIDLEFYNMGKSTLYNMFVKMEGDFDLKDSTYYVGNFDAGNSDTYSATIIPKHIGEARGNIIFSFEDETGEKSEIRKEIKVNAVEESSSNNDFSNVNVASDSDTIQTSKKSNKMIPILGVIIALIILGFIIAKIRKNKIKKDED